MGIASAGRKLIARVLQCLAVVALAAAFGVAGLSPPAAAQIPPSQAAPRSQMLLEADALTYDNDAGVVTAAGNVRIDYNGTKLVADKVTFYQKTKRLIAYGNVQIVDRDGNRNFADEIDVTSNLRDGFINALRIETTDKTYFASESAERRDGNITTFNNGIYTACEPCEENPDKAPIWRIKSTRIIWNGKKKTIRFINPRMEFFGLPIAYFPAFEIPDHTVKRKSGFLFPTYRFDTNIGFGVGVPYYWALSPTYDLTTTVTGYTKVGFLTEAEWRQRFDSGQYNIHVAGIYQLPLGKAAVPGAKPVFRGMIGTAGRFEINPRWAFGWNLRLQSDASFSTAYSIKGYGDPNTIYLTGLNDRNYFDLRTMRFKEKGTVQPWVLPQFDYSYIPDRPVAGGELKIDVNAQSIRRDTLSVLPTSLTAGTNIPGAQGNSTRLTAQVGWRRNLFLPGGLVLTPILNARGDAIFTNFSAATQAAIAGSTIGGIAVPNTTQSTFMRYMATAGLEARWPIVFTTPNTSHVIEPMGQIFARPDEPFATKLGIPNEDAQSMVFDATRLFEQDKFSGYDRVEGGVRANLGVRYSGTFANGWTANAIVGQSYHLAGLNSYGAPDFVNAGAYSGLETAKSDYVGMVGVLSPVGTAASVSARFDETTFELRRMDVQAGTRLGPVSLAGSYAYIQAQPRYGYPINRHQITAGASARVHENWRVFGSATYDLVAGKVLQDAFGFAYDDECFSFTLAASQLRDPATNAVSNSFGVNFSFRTIGDFSPGTLSAPN